MMNSVPRDLADSLRRDALKLGCFAEAIEFHGARPDQVNPLRQVARRIRSLVAAGEVAVALHFAECNSGLIDLAYGVPVDHRCEGK
ncbi:MAG: hypothetical protein H0W42_11915 [Gemmatimonadaceae bacterium]|nr:hypothetical protein [Gemmatimonadaceae bacterium]